MNKLFDLSNIDWIEIDKQSQKSIVKEACELWNDNNKNRLIVSGLMKIGKDTISRYLKQGAKLGWCEYDPKNEFIRNYFYKLFGRSTFRSRWYPIQRRRIY